MDEQGARWRSPFLAPGILIALFVLLPGPTSAQDDSAGGSAQTDTLSAETATGLGQAISEVLNQEQADQDGSIVRTHTSGPYFSGFVNAPKAGAKANVRQNTYYGELVSTLSMRANSSFTNTFKWSFDEYRKQNKNVERRSNTFNYNLGQTLPVILRLDGNWSWSHDKTVNTAGFKNLFATDNKSLRLAGSQTKLRAAGLTHSYTFGASIDDRVSENQGTANNANEGTIDGGLQTGWTIRPGLVVAGRIYGSARTGDKTLGLQESPSSTNGDSLGIGVYYDQGFTNGRVAVTRSSFRKKYLDFKKNSSGLIDTVGVDEALKIIDEIETRDAVSIEFENNFRIGPVSFTGALTRTTDDLDYAVNGQGLKERLLDVVALQSSVVLGADSLSVKYDYGWKWDDQRIQGATSNRGRQFNKSRDLEFAWARPFFQKTEVLLRFHQGLRQDIAQFEHNQNDKDRLQSDFSVQVERVWPRVFQTMMVYSFRETQDLSIQSTRSSNNNLKELYEITPSYSWYVAPWLTWNQNYRVSIQYTDYLYSHLASVNREDSYNKRGNLTTKVTVNPTKRLQVILRHDYNKKFNATKSTEDASGKVFYNRDLNQTISKLDLGMKFRVLSGVTLEAATYRTRDDRENPGRINSEITEFAGEIWVGARVNRTWRQAITLSAVVKKYNAFGPAITETSANYWEADVWLKWEF